MMYHATLQESEAHERRKNDFYNVSPPVQSTSPVQ